MSKNQTSLNNTRISFLLTFFKQDVERYEEKEWNGFWLIKQWDGAAKKWTVHIYSKESYSNYINKGKEQFNLFSKVKKEVEELDNQFKESIL